MPKRLEDLRELPSVTDLFPKIEKEDLNPKNLQTIPETYKNLFKTDIQPSSEFSQDAPIPEGETVPNSENGNQPKND